MDRLPLRRILPYLLGALVVLAVGGWSLRAFAGQPISGEEVTLGGALSPAGGGGSGGPSTAEPGTAVTPSTSSTESTEPRKVFVQIAGAVRRPGVYEVPQGARVFEALLRAGGVTPEGDEQALPLAAVVTDGMRLVVPVKGQAAPGNVVAAGATSGNSGGSAAGPSAPAPGAPVSLNAASASELETLPGIGPKTAERIVAYREANGPFGAVEDLDDVPGIGPATVERLRGLVQP